MSSREEQSLESQIDEFYSHDIQYSLTAFRRQLESELSILFPRFGTDNQEKIDSKIDYILKKGSISSNQNLNLEIKYYLLTEASKEIKQVGHLKKNIIPALKIIDKFLQSFDSTFFSFCVLSEDMPETSYIEWLAKNGYKPYVFYRNYRSNVFSTTLFKKIIHFFRRKYFNKLEKLRWDFETIPNAESNYPLSLKRFIVNLNYLYQVGPTLCYKIFLDTNDLVNPLKLNDEKIREFEFPSRNIFIQIEMKYLLVHSVISGEWSYTHAAAQSPHLKRVQLFLDEVFPNRNSLLDIPYEYLISSWEKWLQRQGFKTEKYNMIYSDGNSILVPGVPERSIRSYWNTLSRFYDSCPHVSEETFKKDRWSIEKISNEYDLEVNLASLSKQWLNFEKILSEECKSIIKKYLKEKILSRSISLTTTSAYVTKLTMFSNFMFQEFPQWKDFKKVDRDVMRQYVSYFYNKKKSKDINRLLNEHLQVIRIFLTDLQLFGWQNYAPIKDMSQILTIDDFPKPQGYSPQNDKFIPMNVLKQFFQNINDLTNDCQIIIWIMYFCGLRISDVLGLKLDCVIEINEQYFLKYDNFKSRSKNNYIPLADEELVRSIKELIQYQIENLSLVDNKKKFLFWRYSKRVKKYRQVSKSKVTNDIRALTYKYKIKDKDGQLYFINPHQFRHTFGNHLLESGIDIFTIRHWMGHRSIYPTFIYTRNSRKNLREQYDQAYQKGVFSVIDSSLIDDRPKFESLVKSDTAIVPIRTSYGTCLACDSDRCKLSSAPPCLRVNDDAPCKDLGIGFSEFDQAKYDYLIEDYHANIQYIEKNGTEDNRLQDLKKGLQKVSYIRELLEQGFCIYGRKDRYLDE